MTPGKPRSFKEAPPRPATVPEVAAWSIAQCDTLAELAEWSQRNRDEIREKCTAEDLAEIITTFRAREAELRARDQSAA